MLLAGVDTTYFKGTKIGAVPSRGTLLRPSAFGQLVLLIDAAKLCHTGRLRVRQRACCAGLGAATMSSIARLPLRLLAWGALGVALHIGLARFAYGVVLPSLRQELGLGYTAGGVLNAVHLAGYLVGTLMAPYVARRLGMTHMGRACNALVAAGALLCALAPSSLGVGTLLLGIGRLATGLGAGGAVIAIMVSVLARVDEASRAAASVLMWTGMAAAILGCGLSAAWLLQLGAWRWSFATAAFVSMVLMVGFPMQASAPQTSTGPGFTLASVATPTWAWLISAYGCFGMGYIAYATFAGTRLAAAQAPVAMVTMTWTMLGLATLCGSAATLWLLGRPTLRAFALPVALALAAAGCAVTAQAGAAAALAGAVLVGLGMAAIPALVPPPRVSAAAPPTMHVHSASPPRYLDWVNFSGRCLPAHWPTCSAARQHRGSPPRRTGWARCWRGLTGV